MSQIETNFSDLKKSYSDSNEEKTHLEKKVANFKKSTQRLTKPDFPRHIMVEVTNICNHKCTFCAYSVMERSKGSMPADFFYKTVKEAYDLGAREIGLFSGAEPLTCRHLEEFVSFCVQTGYEYLYISTNGSLAKPQKLKGLIDNGLSSLKFSVNGGTREVYKKIHGADHFDRVVENIEFLNNYRKKINKEIFLGISFVEVEENKHTFIDIKKRFTGIVDEIAFYKGHNSSGQMTNLPPMMEDSCDLPFNRIHISYEGYLRACCNDYENLLAMEDLNSSSLEEAWHSQLFQSLRQRHLDDDLSGSLCGACIKNCKSKISPLNYKLAHMNSSRSNT